MRLDVENMDSGQHQPRGVHNLIRQGPFDPTYAARGPDTGMSETSRGRIFDGNEPDDNLGGQRPLVVFRLGNSLVILNVWQILQGWSFLSCQFCSRPFTGLDCFGYFEKGKFSGQPDCLSPRNVGLLFLQAGRVSWRSMRCRHSFSTPFLLY